MVNDKIWNGYKMNGSVSVNMTNREAVLVLWCIGDSVESVEESYRNSNGTISCPRDVQSRNDETMKVWQRIHDKVKA